jgi:hypothetical protein
LAAANRRKSASTITAAEACVAVAVAAAHEVGEFAFDFGSGGLVVGLPVGVGLALPGAGQDVFVGVDVDGAPGGGGGALGTQRAVGARRPEGGDPAAVAVSADRCGHAPWEGDGVGAEIDTEAAFAEQPTRWRRRLLIPAPGSDVVVLQKVLGFELAAPIGAIAVDLRPALAFALVLALAVSRPAS